MNFASRNFSTVHFIPIIFYPKGGHGGKAADVSRQFKLLCSQRIGFLPQQIALTAVSDLAATAITVMLNLEASDCWMHQLSKVLESALGLLTRSRGGKIQNPFPAGVANVQLLKDLSSGARSYNDYVRFKVACQAVGCKIIRPQMPLTIRIGGTFLMLQSILRTQPAFLTFRKNSKSTVKLVETLGVSDVKWLEFAELYGVLNICHRFVVLSQQTRSYNGGFKGLVIIEIYAAYTAASIKVADIAAIAKGSTEAGGDVV